MIKLFSCKKGDRTKYVTPDKQICQNCDKNIDVRFFLLCQWGKQIQIDILCHHCINKFQKIPNQVTELKAVSIIRESELLALKSDAVLISEPQLMFSSKVNPSFISHGERIIDRTKQCHNPNFMIDKNAKTPEQIETDLKEKDKYLNKPIESEEGLDSIFQDILLQKDTALEKDDTKKIPLNYTEYNPRLNERLVRI